MDKHEVPGRSHPGEHERSAEFLVAKLFEKAGWKVERIRHDQDPSPDFFVRKRGVAYAVEVKAVPEGRSDRLVPLFAQAVLQSARSAGENAAPLAVVAAPKIASRLAEQVLRFADRYAPDAAVGVIDFEGLRIFRGPHLEGLNAPPPDVPSMPSRSARDSGDLFSDLNQWMLKVLIARDIPNELLSAPRGFFRNASQLAAASGVSVMSAFRLVQQLQREGHLNESAPYLDLVRRGDLFNRWQAAVVRSVREVPMRFVFSGDIRMQLRKMVHGGRACLALFAAADALNLGFVQGVPPYVYVQRVQPAYLAAWKNLRPCAEREPPDVIVRQAPAPNSVFRGMIQPSGMAVSDVLQIWLDVSGHPSRGREQADLIRRRVLQRVIDRKV